MNLNFAAVIFPLAILLMVVEYWISKKLQKKYYDFNRTVSNLSVGIAERLLDLFLHGSFYLLFQYVYNHYALFSISNAWYVWLFLLLLTDFVWYWYHRLGHEINLFWAFHIVHHQSEDYNFSVAARITNLQSLVRNLFWCVLPWIGFKPEMVSLILVIHSAYSFFTHTQMGKNLKWLEYIFITPSLHSVHHATNEEYLDKNYGDVFVFWDKMFGTFQKEEAKPVFGLTLPLKSYSFLWQHFHYLAEVFYRMANTAGFYGKLKVLLAKPEIMEGNEREILEQRLFLKRQKHKKFKGGYYKSYVTLQIIAALLFAFLTILFSNYFTVLSMFFSITTILLTLVNCGALMEQRRWIVFVEYMRFFVLLTAFGYYVDNSICYLFVALTSFSIIIYYQQVKSNYYRLVYNTSRI